VSRDEKSGGESADSETIVGAKTGRNAEWGGEYGWDKEMERDSEEEESGEEKSTKISTIG